MGSDVKERSNSRLIGHGCTSSNNSQILEKNAKLAFLYVVCFVPPLDESNKSCVEICSDGHYVLIH